jgi:hypothetical protein
MVETFFMFESYYDLGSGPWGVKGSNSGDRNFFFMRCKIDQEIEKALGAIPIGG